ncbi:MAG: M48 family metallopeptidase [Chitinophagales bacterium]
MELTLLYLIVAFLVAEYALGRVLEWLNHRQWAAPVPGEIADLFNAEERQKAVAYASHQYYFQLLSSTVSLAITLSFLLNGGFAWADALVRSMTNNETLRGLLFFGGLMVASSLLMMPFTIYDTFVIEAKYGFNKTTARVFIADKIKEFLLGAIIGGLLYAVLAWLYQQFGTSFWWMAWAVAGAFVIGMAAFYTAVLLPIFNKLTPLEEGPVRQAIEAYAQKVTFPLQKILVMDGSTRSSKANAFFSGLGRQKSIVLYDTLLTTLSTNEITAVLAHEVGHYKHRHILQSMVLSLLQLGILFLLFGWVAAHPALPHALGAQEPAFYLSLVAFALLYSPVALLVGVFMNLFSRKNEYEADAYARTTYSEEPLISSLKKLYVNSLGNPNPHPAYVFVHYSHPTLVQRIRKMRQAAAG